MVAKTEKSQAMIEKILSTVNCTPKVRQKKSNFWGVLL